MHNVVSVLIQMFVRNVLLLFFVSFFVSVLTQMFWCRLLMLPMTSFFRSSTSILVLSWNSVEYTPLTHFPPNNYRIWPSWATNAWTKSSSITSPTASRSWPRPPTGLFFWCSFSLHTTQIKKNLFSFRVRPNVYSLRLYSCVYTHCAVFEANFVGCESKLIFLFFFHCVDKRERRTSRRNTRTWPLRDPRRASWTFASRSRRRPSGSPYSLQWAPTRSSCILLK